jgi:MoxR-like ATPase
MHIYVGYPKEKSERDIMLLVRDEEAPSESKATRAEIERVSQDSS